MKALIFDFDGTIINTEQPELTAWQHIYAEFGFEFPLIEYVGIAYDIFNPLAHLESLVGESLNKKHIEKTRTEILAGFTAELKPLPGVLEWIQAAHEIGIPVAIASNATHQFVYKHLERIGFLHYFAEIATRENVDHPKPAPDIYHYVLKKLNIAPGAAMAIEDSIIGASAAVAAGLRCILVPNKIINDLKFPSASYIIENLNQLTLQEAIKKIWT